MVQWVSTKRRKASMLFARVTACPPPGRQSIDLCPLASEAVELANGLLWTGNKTTVPSKLGTFAVQASQRLAREPCGAASIECVELGAVDPGHVRLHVKTVPGLQIGQVAVAFGEAHQQVGIEGRACRGVNGVEPVFLIDRLTQHETPAAIPLLEEIVKAADAGEIAHHALDRCAMQDRHL